MQPFVDIHDVTHVYAGAEDGAPAVERMTMKVREGEFAALVGPSGCGKSTVMKLATGLQFPASGTVIVAGEEVRAPVKLAGMAFQNPVMLPWRTDARQPAAPAEMCSRHPLAACAEHHRRKVRRPRPQNTSLAEVVLRRARSRSSPGQLSGGMQQGAPRSVARADPTSPKLLMPRTEPARSHSAPLERLHPRGAVVPHPRPAGAERASLSSSSRTGLRASGLFCPIRRVPDMSRASPGASSRTGVNRTCRGLARPRGDVHIPPSPTSSTSCRAHRRRTASGLSGAGKRIHDPS